MAYYRICPYCGAHLDPGERCDCQGKEMAARDAADILGGRNRKEPMETNSVSIIADRKGGCQDGYFEGH